MSRRRISDDPLSTIALGLLVFLSVIPIGWLVLQSLGIDDASSGPGFFLSARVGRLALRSLLIASGTTVVALSLGVPSGLALASLGPRARALGMASGIAILMLSPYLFGLAFLGGGLSTLRAADLLGRAEIVPVALGLAFSPLVAIVVALATSLIPRGAVEAALLTPKHRVLRRIVIPQLGGVVGALALLVFGLALSDSTVASLFQVPTYPVEIFLYYAGVFRPIEAARACLPLVIAGVALAFAATWLWPSSARYGSGVGSWDGRVSAGNARTIHGIGIVAVFLLALVIVELASWAIPMEQSLDAISSGWPAALNSLGLSATASMICLVLGFSASRPIHQTNVPRNLAALLLIPLFVPDSAWGIAWAELSATLPVWILPPTMTPIISIVSKFGGLTTLGLVAGRRAIPSEPLGAASLQEPRPWFRESRVVLPHLLPLLVGIFGICFAWSLQAAGVLVLTVPPGFELLPLRCDNLLHYGAQGEAAALGLFAGCCASVSALLGLGISRWIKHQLC